MRFSQLLSSAFTFAAVVYGQVTNGQNAIIYPLGGTLESSTPVQIQWTPSTTGTITIKLLKGPPENIQDIDVIADAIQNSGTFTWNIPKSLQDSGSMAQGDKYGLKIIDDLTNTFEYSPPFDLSIPDSTFGATSLAPVSSTPTPTITSLQSTSATSTSSLLATTSATTTSNSTDVQTTTLVPTTTATQLESFLNTTQLTTSATITYPSTVAQPTNTRIQSEDMDSGSKHGFNMRSIVSVVCGVVSGFILAAIALVMVIRRRNQHRKRSPSVTLNKRSTSMLYSDAMMYSRV